MTITAMTYNVLNGNTAAQGRDWGQRRGDVAALISEAGPDFCGLQEAFDYQLDDLLDLLPDYGSIGQGRQGGRDDEYSAILYREARWEVVSNEDFWLSTTPDRPGSVSWDSSLTRMVTLGRFRDEQMGTEVVVANTHFDHRGVEARRESAELLHRRLADESDAIVATGDFNAEPGSDPYRILTSPEPPGLKDTCESAVVRRGPQNTFHSWGEEAGARIDWVLCSSHFAVRSVEVIAGTPAPSDHHPVVAELVLD